MSEQLKSILENGLTSPTAPPQRLSAVAAALEQVYQALVDIWPELPTVAITLFRDPRRKNVQGYFWHGQWRCAGGELPELHVSSTLLDEPAENLLCVLVHEAAHARASILCIRDTSRRGRYHNGRFAELAREMGLEVAYDRRHGYYTPSVEQAWLEGPYKEMVQRLERVVGHLWQEPAQDPTASRRRGQPEGSSRSKAGRLLKVVCWCQPPRILRPLLGEIPP